MKHRAWTIGFLVVGLLGWLTAAAPSTGVLTGTVVDANGRALPGAKISAISPALNQPLSTVSDAGGEWRLENVTPGVYRLTVERAGFISVVKRDLKVTAGKTLRVDVRLSPDIKLEVEETAVAADASAPQVRHRQMKMAGHPRGGYAGLEAPTPMPQWNTEEYAHIDENRFHNALESPLSTFSIDVDTASYANVRRFINMQQRPHQDAVRIEELVNYFHYEYPEPKGRHPFSISTEISICPWNNEHYLMMVGIQGKRTLGGPPPASNLVFLIDVSGSMNSPAKLPLLKRSFKLLTSQLSARDRVAMVVYAGAAGVVLPSTAGDKADTIMAALERLRAGGSTAGAAGIQLAYKVAEEGFIKGGNNRIILATDGDFNVGVSSTSDLVSLVEKKSSQGIFLTVLGFGMGNYKDARMEQMADKGNGNYHYIDSILEGRKVFVHDMLGTLFTIAKDVKIQVEFNPAHVKGYRLVGYENRRLENEDFADDTKDAGELGAGHAVTAFYEIVPAGSDEVVGGSGDLKYQDKKITPDARRSPEWATVKFRYKKPDKDTSILIEQAARPLKKAPSAVFRFASAVAEWGLLLRDSPFKADADYAAVAKRAREARGEDPYGYREEFIRLVETAALLKETEDKPESAVREPRPSVPHRH
ncbi:MAG TPA: DUF3520 domain-containing protein [Candidatus Aminicenantes bacterium]|nr:DUF3520 domain-containing protein [Candidatus Aminicenantes bacterium]